MGGMAVLRPLLVALALLSAHLAPVAAPLAAEVLVADLSRHLVAITTGFGGADLLLFGAVTGEGDMVVVVRGPPREQVVRRKARRGGLWVNAASARVTAPSFYHVAATRPLAEIAPPAVLERHGIGLGHLDLEARGAVREALVRIERRRGLYGRHVAGIGLLGERLFRTDIHFPGNVPVGTYSVEVYLFRDGRVAGFETTPLVVSQIGLGADIRDFAHRHAALYGLIAVAVAAASGWAAAVAFRR